MRTKLLSLVLIALVGLLVVALTALGSQRTTLMEDRQQKTRNLIEVAHGIVVSHYELEKSGKLSREEAQARAKTELRSLRYDKTEYFWINDMTPVMVMHPIKPELEGKNLSETKDPAGKFLFVEFVKAVQSKGEGFVDYLWPKPGADKPVPKISYVKGFAPWGWVIGSGIYIDDIDAAFWRNSFNLLVVVIATVVVMLLVGIKLAGKLIQQLGAEPAYTVGVVQRIAAGHLDTSVKLNPNDKDSLLAQIGGMQTQLSELIRQIRTSADSIGDMAQTVSARSTEVSTGSVGQNDAASSMAVAVNEMTESINQIASNAERANKLSLESGQLSRDGSKVIDRAMSEMNLISEAVHQTSDVIDTLAAKTQTITSIVNVIHDVADQTNLLALNAAIEAARAGEQGRGFAVVADEVRKLAERTSNATREITAMITDIQQSSQESKSTMVMAVQLVATGVELAGQGGEAVRRIEESAGRVVGVVENISAALKEQTLANNLVSQQVSRISGTASSNASSAHTAAEVTSHMQQLTEQLRTAVNRFHI
ncbi:chemotaxis protein [Chitinimonas sp. BJB300]|nr:chemotaxis protein [Chitinimonas sp. BJB300]